jgi:hypothetical protein
MKPDGKLAADTKLRSSKYLTDNFDKPFLAIQAFFCSTSATPFFRPDRNPIALPYRAAVKDGHHSAAARRACP